MKNKKWITKNEKWKQKWKTKNEKQKIKKWKTKTNNKKQNKKNMKKQRIKKITNQLIDKHIWGLFICLTIGMHAATYDRVVLV